MASDSDYMSFLNKANSQREAGNNQPHTESSAPSQYIRTKTVEPDAAVPSALKEVDAFYISETDEPFEPVVLKWEGAAQGTWPSSDQFASLIASTPSSNLSQAIERLSPSSFDPRGQYASVIKAVQAAAASDPTNADVNIYRVEIGHNRVEYWIVALDAAAGMIVGLKAKAIES
ncbi:hypothetical protein PISL3812_06170 [Talaromyces islandicus]|uniref:Uncharacterized protein n=1 Tax=Talaromyces islandicus TaxID=28573 RepID=A0A0U1M0R3_TALIS|nr:hypothetical protein PISL3812_06170 [Talaromyces islandicus]